MAFVQRQITATFTLANGVFPGGAATFTAAGLRASVRLENGGGFAMPVLHMVIWGMPLSAMNKLSTMGVKVTDQPRSTVTVFAGDAVSGMTQIFTGNVINAFPDLSQMPQVAINVEATALMFDAVASATPFSAKGAVSVDTVLQNIAKQFAGGAGLPYVNNGLNVTLNNPYFWGSPREQFTQALFAAGGGWNGGQDGRLLVWPQNGTNGNGQVIISSATGMVMSPCFTPGAIIIKTLFNPQIKQGTILKVFSQVLIMPPGVWRVYYVSYQLDAQVPKGEWFVTCYAVSQPAADMLGPGNV